MEYRAYYAAFLRSDLNCFQIDTRLIYTKTSGRSEDERIILFHGLNDVPVESMFKVGDRGVLFIEGKEKRGELRIGYQSAEIRDIVRTTSGLNIAFYVSEEGAGPFESKRAVLVSQKPPEGKPLKAEVKRTRYLRRVSGDHPGVSLYFPGGFDRRFKPNTKWTVGIYDVSDDPFWAGRGAEFPCILKRAEDWADNAFWLHFDIVVPEDLRRQLEQR